MSMTLDVRWLKEKLNDLSRSQEQHHFGLNETKLTFCPTLPIYWGLLMEQTMWERVLYQLILKCSDTIFLLCFIPFSFILKTIWSHEQNVVCFILCLIFCLNAVTAGHLSQQLFILREQSGLTVKINKCIQYLDKIYIPYN